MEYTTRLTLVGAFKIIVCVALSVLVLSCGTGSQVMSNTGACDGYPEPSTSKYVLPFKEGTTVSVSQGNCSPITHNGRAKYAYDFGEPEGTDVHAARLGRVIEAGDVGGNFSCGGIQVWLEHLDGSVAHYFHLKKDSIVVVGGEWIDQGRKIGEVGDTGCTGGFDHLHFHVVPGRESVNFNTMPITFKNATNNSRGLIAPASYLVESYTPSAE